MSPKVVICILSDVMTVSTDGDPPHYSEVELYPLGPSLLVPLPGYPGPSLHRTKQQPLTEYKRAGNTLQ